LIVDKLESLADIATDSNSLSGAVLGDTLAGIFGRLNLLPGHLRRASAKIGVGPR